MRSRARRFPLVPTHTLAAGVELDLPYGVAAGVSGNYVGERYLRGDEANQEPPLAGYATADARLSAARRGWTLELEVRNITDTQYVAFGTFNINQGAGDALERFLTPGRPRSFSVTLRREL